MRLRQASSRGKLLFHATASVSLYCWGNMHMRRQVTRCKTIVVVDGTTVDCMLDGTAADCVFGCDTSVLDGTAVVLEGTAVDCMLHGYARVLLVCRLYLVLSIYHPSWRCCKEARSVSQVVDDPIEDDG